MGCRGSTGFGASSFRLHPRLSLIAKTHISIFYHPIRFEYISAASTHRNNQYHVREGTINISIDFNLVELSNLFCEIQELS